MTKKSRNRFVTVCWEWRNCLMMIDQCGIQLLVTIVIPSFTMGKRETSYSLGIRRNRHSICVPKWKKMQFVLSDLRVSKSSLLGKLFLSVITHQKDTVSSNLISCTVTAKLPYLTLPLRLVQFHQLLFCRRSCDARKTIITFFFTLGLDPNESIFLSST